jgi:hypothetical protein
MTINFHEDWRDKSGEWKTKEATDSKGQFSTTRDQQLAKTYHRSFIAWADPPFTLTPLDIYNLPQCPKRGEAYPNDLTVVASTVEATQDATNPAVWNVRVEYTDRPLMATEPPDDKREGGENRKDPTQEKPKRTFSFEKTTRVVPLLNSAGDPVEPGTAEDFISIITVRKKVAVADYNQLSGAIGTVNQDDYLGFPASTARIGNINISDPIEQHGFRYVELTYTIIVKKQGWQIDYYDYGYNDFATGKKAKIVIDGIAGLHALDGGGLRADKAALLSVFPYDASDFNALGL